MLLILVYAAGRGLEHLKIARYWQRNDPATVGIFLLVGLLDRGKVFFGCWSLLQSRKAPMRMSVH